MYISVIITERVFYGIQLVDQVSWQLCQFLLFWLNVRTVSDIKLWPFLHTSLSVYSWWKFSCFCKWLCSRKFERIAIYCCTLQDSCDRAGVRLVYNNWICLQETVICLTACDAGSFPYFCYSYNKRSTNIFCTFLLSATFFIAYIYEFWTSTHLLWKQIWNTQWCNGFTVNIKIKF
jgi:hypothetical protein